MIAIARSLIDVVRHRDHGAPFTGLTNAFSRKAEYHPYSMALYFIHCNYCRTHKSLRMMPAMAVGLVSSSWEVEDLVALVETQS